MITAFTLAVLLSSALLFLIEPMFARMVLPLLGGTPAVWNTCVVFYQAALFAGYLYAYLLDRTLSVRRQAMAHLFLLGAAALVLPFTADTAPPASSNPIWWVFGLLSTTVGPPFFALAATGPLFQRWFSVSAYPASPWPLYAASNAGSLIALLAYPFVVEPLIGLHTQRQVWTWLYGTFVLLAAVCAATLWRRHLPQPEPLPAPGRAKNASATTAKAHGLKRVRHRNANASADDAEPEDLLSVRLRWLGLAAIPSTLMLSVTTYLTTDIASVPLLWVLPLSIYLLTLIAAFAERQVVPVRIVNLLSPLAIVGVVALSLAGNALPVGAAVAGHMGCFTAIALECHLRLAAERPDTTRLTEFYLWLAGGGALGGIFNTLVAPVIFVTPLEYPLAAIAASLLLPSTKAWPAAWTSRLGIAAATIAPAVLFVGLTIATRQHAASLPPSALLRYALGSVPALIACFLMRRSPMRMGIALGIVAVVGSFLRFDDRVTVHVERTFFGVHRVTYNGLERVLMSGTTNHGSQSVVPALACEPLTYYSRQGPVGQLFSNLPSSRVETLRVGVVGLGTATMAAYASPKQTWTFFEINPAIERLARRPDFFTYLRDCAPNASVVIGDARLALTHVPDGSFELLMIDAFSSDAIPVHLMTREAMALYFSKLTAHGLIAFHISNRYLNLTPVTAALARSAGGVAMQAFHVPSEEDGRSRGLSPSRWVVVGRRDEDLGGLVNDSRWQSITALDGPLWTDDYSNLIGIIQ